MRSGLVKPRRAAAASPRKTSRVVVDDDTTPTPPEHNGPTDAILSLTDPINHVSERRLPSLIAGLLAANIPNELSLIASEFSRACVQTESNAVALIEACPTLLQAFGVRLMTDANPLTRDNLLVALRTMSETDRHKEEIVEAVGLVQSLVNILGSGTTNEVHEASRILMNISDSEHAAQLISSTPGVRLGVVTAATEVAGIGNDATKPNCLAILANLCRCADNLFATSTECLEQLSVIIRLLLHGRPPVQYATCRPLAEFFSSPEIHDHLDTGRILLDGKAVTPDEVVAALLKIASETTSDKATVFSSLALCVEGASAASQKKAVGVLADEMKTASTVSAIRALAHVCEEIPQAHGYLFDSNSLDSLITLLDSGSLEVKEASVQLVSALCAGSPRVIVKAPAALRALMTLAAPSNGSEFAAQTALTALSRISADSEAVATLAQYPNVTSSLLALMERPDAAPVASVIIRHVTAVNKSSTPSAPSTKGAAPTAAPAATSSPTSSAAPTIDASVTTSLLFLDARPVTSSVFVFQSSGGVTSTLFEMRDSDLVWTDAEQLLGEGADSVESSIENYVSSIWERVSQDEAIASLITNVVNCVVSISLTAKVEFESAVIDRAQAAFSSAWESRLEHGVETEIVVTDTAARSRYEFEAASHLAGETKPTTTISIDFVSHPAGVLTICSKDATSVTSLHEVGGATSDHVANEIKQFSFGRSVLFLDDFRFASEKLLESLQSTSPKSKALAALERVLKQNVPIGEARGLIHSPEATSFEGQAAEDIALALTLLGEILTLGSFASDSTARIQVLFDEVTASWCLGLVLHSPSLFKAPPPAHEAAPTHSDEPHHSAEVAADQWTKSLHSLVTSSDPRQRNQALLCASEFANPSLGYQVTQSIGVRVLEEIAAGSDVDLRAAAVDLLEQYLSQANPTEIAAVAESTGRSLAQVLELRAVHAESRAVGSAVKALRHLAASQSVPNALVSAGAITALIELAAKDEDAEQQGTSLDILAHVTNTHAAKLPTNAVDAITNAAVSALGSPNAFQVEQGVSIAVHLAQHAPNSLSSIIVGAFDAVLQRPPTSHATNEILSILSRVLTQQPDRLRPILEKTTTHGGILALLDKNAIDASHVAYALHVLTAFEGDIFAEALAASSSIWNHITSAFAAGDSHARDSAAKLSAAMSELTGATHDQIEGVYGDTQRGPAIIRGIGANCAETESEPIRHQALHALHRITETHSAARARVVQDDALIHALSTAMTTGDAVQAELSTGIAMHIASDPSNQPALGEMSHLVDALCQSYEKHRSNAAVAKHVAGSFALMTQSAETHETFGAARNVIQTLTKLTESKDEQVAEYASRAVANLLVLDQNQVTLFNDTPLVDAIIGVAAGRNAGAQAAAAAALSFFANNPSNSQAVASHLMLIPTLLRAIRTGNETAQEDSLVGLGAVCEIPAVQELIGKVPGGLGGIVAVLQPQQNTSIVEAASWVLANLSRNDANKIMLSEGKTFDHLAECLSLENTPAHHVIKENCASAIALLTRDTDNQVIVSKNQALMAALISCIDTNAQVTEGTRLQCLTAIANAASARNSSLRFVTAPGAVRNIVSNGLSEQQAVHETAGRIAMLVSRDHDARAALLHDALFSAMLANLLNDTRRSQSHDAALRTISALVGDRDVSLTPLVSNQDLIVVLKTMGDYCSNQKNKTFARELIGKFRVPVHTPRAGAGGRVTPRK
eukprot:c11670_g1_i2.p1 GENE.c11670_g1_i2~~c11670_g1_i2.p1  ORF type:complete len:1718 (+),score=440.64 c11670_g1_i2:34-5187(+)